MAEYREVRGQTTFLELCKNPQLCSEVMCTAVDAAGRRRGDHLLRPAADSGADGAGPGVRQGRRAGHPQPGRERRPTSIACVELEDLDALDFVIETVRQTRADLPADIPLIGFAGAPFTLASYAIEGGSSRNYLHTKTLMYRDEGAWRTLMERLARSITRYLNAQIAAGCPGGAALRQLGRLPGARRLSPLRAAVSASRSSTASRPACR